MGDRNHHRDRTLVLRILVPTLETAIRDKMAAAEMQYNNPSQKTTGEPDDASTPAVSKGTILDLEGVSIEPTCLNPHASKEKASADPTLWSFHCDGAVYPARLVNLPCPVELHKTQDHAIYYKSVDIAQMLIVYEDKEALDEAESQPEYSVDGFNTYFHSGLTPPMQRVVKRRFLKREHKAIPPPAAEISLVEKEILALIDLLCKDSNKKTKSNLQSPSAKSAFMDGTQLVQEEIDDEIVDYEPWMTNYGQIPQGIEFDEKDDICKKHPELWISPQQYTELRNQIQGGPTRGAAIPATTGVGSSTTSTKMKTHNPKTHGTFTASDPTTTHTGSALLVETSTQPKKQKKKKMEERLDPVLPIGQDLDIDEMLKKDPNDELDDFEGFIDFDFSQELNIC